MKKHVLAIALVTLAAGPSMGAQVLKAGLWEIKQTASGAEWDARRAELERKLASMPPDKRERMEAAMRERGALAGAGGHPVMVMHACLTPQEVAGDSALLRTLGEDANCTSKVVANGPGEMRIQATCRTGQGTREVDARISDMAPERYTVDIDSRDARGDVRVHREARWQGSSCGNVR